MRLFQHAAARRSWRWAAAIAMVQSAVAACSGGGGGEAAPEAPIGELELLAGLPRSTVPQSGVHGGLRVPITMDTQGNLYGPSSAPISPEGVVTSLRSDLLSSPVGIAVDAAGSVYTMDSPTQRLIKFTRDGAASVLAGASRASSREQTRDGPGDQASFFRVLALAMDAKGNVYLGDDATLREVTPAGAVSTLAGRAGLSDSLDGPGSAARFRGILAMAVEPGSGRLVVADAEIGLRTVAPDGSVATPGGRSSFGSSDGTGPQARFSFPQGVAADALGNAYVTDRNSGTVRKVSGGGVVTTIVGVPVLGGFVADGVGQAAQLSIPTSMASDAAGNLYVIDFGLSADEVRRITPQAVVSTVFNLGDQGVPFDFACVRRDAELTDVAVDAAGSVYFVGTDRSIICKFTVQGDFVLVAGHPGESGSADGPVLSARFSSPTHLAFDAAGNLYVSDAGNHTVRKITPEGVVSTVAGQAGQAGDVDSVGAAARFSTPGDLAAARDGSVYVADIGNRAVRRLAPDGTVSTVVRGGDAAATLGDPTALAIGPGGELYIADDVQNVLWRVRVP